MPIAATARPAASSSSRSRRTTRWPPEWSSARTERSRSAGGARLPLEEAHPAIAVALPLLLRVGVGQGAGDEPGAEVSRPIEVSRPADEPHALVPARHLGERASEPRAGLGPHRGALDIRVDGDRVGRANDLEPRGLWLLEVVREHLAVLLVV